jgi:septum formation protein
VAVALPFRLTLASGSRGRRELLALHGYTFDVRPADIFEPTEAADGDIRHYVAELAWRKAAAVAPHVADGVVVAADTVGWQHGRVVGKPDDEAHARRIITAIQGTTHELWSGVCVWDTRTGLQTCWQELSVVAMKPQSEPDIEAYLQTRKWVGCSGAYAIEMPNDPLLSVVQGSTSNVIGLPMESLERVLEYLARLLETPQRAAV